MDKLINKVKKSLDKAEKQTKTLLKADKIQDKKLDKCSNSCNTKRKHK